MIRETVPPLSAEVEQVRDALDISQNAVARRAKLHPSTLSRLLAGTITAGPSEKKLRSWLGAQKRRLKLVATEKAS